MGYKWKPSKAQRREFAKNMEDPDFAHQYYKRKEKRAEKRRATSRFDYESAGGRYVPTYTQYSFVNNNMELFVTDEEKDAANMINHGYSCNESVHHDYIHIVNEKIRGNG